MKNNLIIIFITCASKREASAIAGSLLKKRLVACANIVHNIRSGFWWMGKIDKAAETLVICKTTKSNFKAVEIDVKKNHSYDVPEIAAVPIVLVSKEYRRWVEDSVR